MQTIVVAGQKGGGGKTTLVAHLAVAAERAGHGPVVVIDTDPQQTLATWWQAREADIPKLAPINIREVQTKFNALAGDGIHVLLRRYATRADRAEPPVPRTPLTSC